MSANVSGVADSSGTGLPLVPGADSSAEPTVGSVAPVQEPAVVDTSTAATQPQPGQQQPQTAQPGVTEDAVQKSTSYRRLSDGLNGIAQKLMGDDEFKAFNVANPTIDARFTKYNEVLQSKIDQLSELETASKDVALKIDAPLSQWGEKLGEKLEAMPEQYRDQLYDHVFRNHIDTLVTEALDHPDQYPEEVGYIQRAVHKVAEQSWGRPVAELDAIHQATGGFTPNQIDFAIRYALSNGSNDPNVLAAGLVGTGTQYAQSLGQVFTAEGFDVTDPSVQKVMGRLTVAMRNFDIRDSQLERRVKELESNHTRSTQEAQEREVQKAYQGVDDQAKTALSQTLTGLTQGYEPKDAEYLNRIITAEAKDLLAADTVAQQYLANAREYAREGQAQRAEAQLGMYTMRGNAIYRRLVGEHSERLAMKSKALQTSDKQKSSPIVSTASNEGTASSADAEEQALWDKLKGNVSPAEVGRIAGQVAALRRARQAG